jgi:hypothetical protein
LSSGKRPRAAVTASMPPASAAFTWFLALLTTIPQSARHLRGVVDISLYLRGGGGALCVPIVCANAAVPLAYTAV